VIVGTIDGNLSTSRTGRTNAVPVLLCKVMLDSARRVLGMLGDENCTLLLMDLWCACWRGKTVRSGGELSDRLAVYAVGVVSLVGSSAEF
jgi:hypothetical protein